MADYYNILGVDQNASKDEIKRAYRKIAMKYHPDKNPGDKVSEEKFKEAANAYNVLSDSEKKSKYDQFGEAGLKGGFGGAGGGMDMNDIFSHFGDIFGNSSGFGGFGDIFGRRGGSGTRVHNTGSNLKIKMRLTLEEINKGVKKKINIKRMVSCDACNGEGGTDSTTCYQCHGTGEVRERVNSMFGQMINVRTCNVCQGEGKIVKNKCRKCYGEGRIQQTEQITIDVPAGVATGHYRTIHGKGNAGKRNGNAGDLIVMFEDIPHETFVRDGSGADIYLIANISWPLAVLGGKITIPTLSGNVSTKLKPGIDSGKYLRLKNKGLPILNRHSNGDQIVKIQVVTPKKLNNNEKKLIVELNDKYSNKTVEISRYKD
ncbi:MAG: molecular chaperone DnaJ [Candidatus Marinimicrobia bacterium]|nr:molecular chaperone DnaJ [Candidatus Neomarinimicrobiota bacterium]